MSCGNLQGNGYQPSSIALNGENIFTSEAQDCNNLTITVNTSLDLPANQVSDLIFVVAASTPNLNNLRRVMLAFINNRLGNLPQGLIYRKLWQ
jgi:hypothetical protein